MADDLRRRYADAIAAVLDRPNGWAYRGTLAYAVLAVRDDEMADLQAQLTAARAASGDSAAVAAWVKVFDRAARAEAAVARVREAHPERDGSHLGGLIGGPVCGTCGERYPCPTIAALDVPADGEQTPTPANEESDHG